MWKNKEQPVVKTGKMCRIAQNYEHGRTLPLHAVRWLGIMIDSQNIPLRRMSTNEIRYRWIIGLFISQYTFIKLNISHIYELFRYINPCIHIYFHDKLVRNWCGVWEATFGKRVHHDRLFVKNESCKEINTVSHLLSCEFNIDTASCIYTQKGNKKIRKPQAANQTALIFDRRAAARLLSINSIRRLCWS